MRDFQSLVQHTSALKVQSGLFVPNLKPIRDKILYITSIVFILIQLTSFYL